MTEIDSLDRKEDRSGRRKGKIRMIPLHKVWKKLERGETLVAIAQEYGICSKTLSETLRRIDKGKYEEIRRRRRREQLILPTVNDVWTRLEQGEALNAIAREYKTSYSVISTALKRMDNERYESVMKSRRRRELNLPVKRLWKELQHGKKVTTIAREYGVNSNTLAHMLQRVYGKKYERIIASRRRGQAVFALIHRVWDGLKHGETLHTLAKRYGVARTTLTRILRRYDPAKYRKLVSSRSRRKLSLIASTLPISKIWAKLEHGKTVIAAAKEYGTCAVTLAKILRSDDKERYDKIVGARRGRRNRGRYGSLDARKKGSDSAIELRVKRLLEKKRARFAYQVNLKLNGHRYQPDFVFGNHTILEVAGLTVEHYWLHYRNKVRNYIEAGYRVFIVTPDFVCKIAKNYLPESSMVKAMEEKDFVKNIVQVLKTIRTTNSELAF